MFRNGYAHQLYYLNRRRTMEKKLQWAFKLKWLYRILQKIHCWVFTYVGAGCNTPLNYDHIFDSIIRRLYALRLIFQVNVSTFILISNQTFHLFSLSSRLIFRLNAMTVRSRFCLRHWYNMEQYNVCRLIQKYGVFRLIQMYVLWMCFAQGIYVIWNLFKQHFFESVDTDYLVRLHCSCLSWVKISKTIIISLSTNH